MSFSHPVLTSSIPAGQSCNHRPGKEPQTAASPQESAPGHRRLRAAAASPAMTPLQPAKLSRAPSRVRERESVGGRGVCVCAWGPVRHLIITGYQTHQGYVICHVQRRCSSMTRARASCVTLCKRARKCVCVFGCAGCRLSRPHTVHFGHTRPDRFTVTSSPSDKRFNVNQLVGPLAPPCG